MHIHILGICGTFMGSLALLARECGHQVSGSDANVYPPMSTQLEEQGIALSEGYNASFLQTEPDLVVVGNAMARGNPAVEALLDSKVPYCSGPEWLQREVLQGRWVLAVAGTHGKTTTTSMLAWILEHAGLQPGFLIGGVAQDFGVSARLGESEYFVIEADEYDSAFFDKRSKFVHYRPRTAILNNMEFDHADIFDSIADIQKQFHHLLRTVPAKGKIIFPQNCEELQQVISMGCWSACESLTLAASDQQPVAGSDWRALALHDDWSRYRVERKVSNGEYADCGTVDWQHSGEHNMANGLAAIAAAADAHVEPATAIKALNSFTGVKRRMEVLAEVEGVTVYDDFAHHPTAIASTLAGLRARYPESRITAVIEPRSNTMRMGVHGSGLQESVSAADLVFWHLDQQAAAVVELRQDTRNIVCDAIDDIVARVSSHSRSGDHVVIMSNGGFSGIHQLIINALQA